MLGLVAHRIDFGRVVGEIDEVGFAIAIEVGDGVGTAGRHGSSEDGDGSTTDGIGSGDGRRRRRNRGHGVECAFRCAEFHAVVGADGDDEVLLTIIVDVAEISSGVVTWDSGCTREGTVAVAHERISNVDIGVVAMEDAVICFPNVDVGIAVAVEIGDGDEAKGIDSDVAYARREGTVAFSDVGE